MKEPILEPILRWLRIKQIEKYIGKDRVVCDIGCGYNAKFLNSISNRIKKGYGFDKKLETKSYGNIHVSKLKVNSIPLKDNSVDCVTMLAVLEHLDHPVKIMLEIERILKPGGYLILTTPSIYGKPVLEFLSFKLGLINKDEILDHKHYYTLNEIKLLYSNFNIIKLKHFQLGMNTFLVAKK